MSNKFMAYDDKLDGFWSERILSAGFVAVPIVLLEYREYLNINTTEMVVLLALLSFRHNNRPVYPSVRKISERSGVQPRAVYHATSSLEKRKLLAKKRRPGHTTYYDLRGLVSELQEIDKHIRWQPTTVS